MRLLLLLLCSSCASAQVCTTQDEQGNCLKPYHNPYFFRDRPRWIYNACEVRDE